MGMGSGLLNSQDKKNHWYEQREYTALNWFDHYTIHLYLYESLKKFKQ